ncbi:hypothetical protein SteCoe_555 [Stentor coeruleus]|uniref:Globin family profile domain-containing protein n=1 Tax=Stentor coeruleus TaxID=5963 RepID=A0A1R2D446_9CILI|nr:hypothetical protein SteCoe_555 [Stentor coeruleus]
MSETLFERIGGTPTITALINSLYIKIESNPITQGAFLGKNIEEIKNYQVKFWSMALGSATPYEGRSMKDAHQQIAVTEEQFNTVVSMLSETMREMNIPEDVYKIAVTHAEMFRSDIVSHKLLDCALEKLGGREKLTKIFEKLYARLTSNPQTGPQFNGKDLSKIIKGHINYWSSFLSTASYTGTPIVEVHQGLRINAEQFNVFLELLGESLKEENVSEEIYCNIMAHMEAYKAEIIE